MRCTLNQSLTVIPMSDSVSSRFPKLIPYEELVSKIDVKPKLEKLEHDSKRLQEQADALKCQFDELAILFKELSDSIQD